MGMNDMPITIFKICDKYTEEQCIEKIKSKLSELKLSVNKLYTKWCQNRYMDTFYERVYNRLCTLIRKECVEDG